MKKMFACLRRLVCNHSWEFKRNIYGDEIFLAGARSEWKCKKCSARHYSEHLVK